MDEQPKTEKPLPEHLSALKEVLGQGLDPELLLWGVRRAKEEAAQHVALQMAQGLIPINTMGVLARLDEMAKAMELDRAKSAFFIGLQSLDSPPIRTPEPAPGEPSVT